MREKPTNGQPVMTMADHIRRRGGIIGDSKDGNGNPMPGHVHAAPIGNEVPQDSPTVAVGQVWRDTTCTEPLLVTVVQHLPATDTKPARWRCDAQATSGLVVSVERAQGYFSGPGIALFRESFALAQPDPTRNGHLTDALANVAHTAGTLGGAVHGLRALAAHIAATANAERVTLEALAQEALGAAQGSAVASEAQEALDRALAAILNRMIELMPTALHGLVFVCEHLDEPVTVSDVAVHINACVGGPETAQAATQDFIDALVPLGKLGMVDVRTAGESPNLTNITVKALPPLRGLLIEGYAGDGNTGR